jgi:hypothetical protein
MKLRHVAQWSWEYLVIIAVCALALIVLGAGTARADDGIDQTICNQLALGQSPGQVIEQLRDGDKRWNGPRGPSRVWSVLPDCPDN